jgi:hypothetical protein
MHACATHSEHEYALSVLAPTPDTVACCCCCDASCGFRSHFYYAGREILQQTHGRLHAFVSGAGTGGTIAGVSQALKGHDPHIQIVLADPQGSSLFNKVSLSIDVGSRRVVSGRQLYATGYKSGCSCLAMCSAYGQPSIGCRVEFQPSETLLWLLAPACKSRLQQCWVFSRERRGQLYAHAADGSRWHMQRGGPVECSRDPQHPAIHHAAVIVCRSSVVCCTHGTKQKASV